MTGAARPLPGAGARVRRSALRVTVNDDTAMPSAASHGVTTEMVIEDILDRVPVP